MASFDCEMIDFLLSPVSYVMLCPFRPKKRYEILMEIICAIDIQMDEWMNQEQRVREKGITRREDNVDGIHVGRGETSKYCITECFMNFIRNQYIDDVNALSLTYILTLEIFSFAFWSVWETKKPSSQSL